MAQQTEHVGMNRTGVQMSPVAAGAGWETLVALASDAGQDDLVTSFAQALDDATAPGPHPRLVSRGHRTDARAWHVAAGRIGRAAARRDDGAHGHAGRHDAACGRGWHARGGYLSESGSR